MNRALYSSLDGDRDRQTGGVTVTNRSGDAIFARYLGQWIMPNFMNIVAMDDYKSVSENGLHELSEGEVNENTLGSPVSQGCFRLTKYGSILLRWWTPLNARTFIYYTNDGYKKWAPKGAPYIK